MKMPVARIATISAGNTERVPYGPMPPDPSNGATVITKESRATLAGTSGGMSLSASAWRLAASE